MRRYRDIGFIRDMEKLQKIIKAYRFVAVAVSGGTDSAIILREAAAALGPNHVLAITVQPGCMPRRRLFVARRVAELSGVEHIVLPVDTLTDSELQQNGSFRCVQCRRWILKAILDEAWARGCDTVLDGRHKGDAQAPAFAVADALSLVSPYCACDMGEAQLNMIRGDAPALLREDSCLYSRIPFGTPISDETIAHIDMAEETLRTAGYAYTQLHVRDGGVLLVAPRSCLKKLRDSKTEITAILEQSGISENALIMAAEDFFA